MELYEDYAANICENYPEECEMVQAQLEMFYTMTANNVETYRIIKEKAKDNKSTSVILDFSFLYRMEAMMMGISIPSSLTIPCKMEYVDCSQMSELEEDLPFVEMCIITPIGDIDGFSLPPFILFENGYWDTPYIIYAHDGAGYTLNEDEKASNKECYDGGAISYA